jgi:hypothetical protein
VTEGRQQAASLGRRRRDALRALLATPAQAGSAILAVEILGVPVSLRSPATLSATSSGWAD